MYCNHCGKLLSDYSGICKSCNKFTDISGGDPVYDAYILAQKQKLRSSLVCSLFVVFVVFIIFMVQTETLIQASKVSEDMRLADSIHTAILTSMMDPEIKNMENYPEDFNALTKEFDITQYTSDKNCILAGTADVLDIDNLHILSSRLKSRGATGRILVTICDPTHVQVRVEGTYVSEYGEEIIIR